MGTLCGTELPSLELRDYFYEKVSFTIEIPNVVHLTDVDQDE